MPQTIRIVNATLYTPEPTPARSLTIHGNRIAHLGDLNGAPEPDAVFDAEGGIVTPGLVDALVHGGGGKRAITDSLSDLHTMARVHGVNGTTAFCCGTFAMPMPDLRRALSLIGEAARNPADDGARILGAYVEGKFGAPKKRGAHDERMLGVPTVDAFMELWKASQETIKVFSYAVELDKNLELTRLLSNHCDEFHGIVPTMGHTNASYDEACRAIDAGIRRATHVFNGMSGLHHRDLGAAEAVLTDARVHGELIADGRHVHPLWGTLLIRLKSSHCVGLITDAMPPSGFTKEERDAYFQTDPETGLQVVRRGEKFAYLINGALYLDPEGKNLTGSIITQREGLENAVRWGISIADAVRMASTSPAVNLGLERKGELRPGFDADIAVFDKEWNPRAVFIEGRAIRNELAVGSRQ